MILPHISFIDGQKFRHDEGREPMEANKAYEMTSCKNYEIRFPGGTAKERRSVMSRYCGNQISGPWEA